MSTRNRSVVLALGAATLLVGPALADDTGREPSAAEQLMVELLNRTRVDPDAEAARHGVTLNEGLTEGAISSGPREPLAVNLCANQAAHDHTKDLFANFSNLPPDHRGSDGRNPTARIADAGVTDYGGGASENNAWISQSKPKITVTSTRTLHRNLFRDFLGDPANPRFEVVGRGHRKVMLNGTRNEVGVAVLGGTFGPRVASITTYNMFTSSRNFITGVAIEDRNGSDFYDMGEGLGGVLIRAVVDGGGASFETTTWKTGGYSLQVPDGTYDVTASGGGLPTPVVFDDVVVAGSNVKVDVKVPKAFDPPPPAGVSVVKALAKQVKKDLSWRLQVKKTTVSFGVLGLDQGQVDSLVVRIDGVTYFDAAARAAEGALVKPKFDAALGLNRKLVLKDAAKNKLVLDLKKNKFTLNMKALPGFDPTDGDVRIQIDTNDFGVDVTVPGTANKKGNKYKLGPADGTFDS